jgi:hypothetical protein
MTRNIHTIELSHQKTYLLNCPHCNETFSSTKGSIQSARFHNQKFIFCCKECSRNYHTIDKDTLALRVLDFYFTNEKIPTFKDFKMNSIYRRSFGNWTNTLKYCGLDFPRDHYNASGKPQGNNWDRQRSRHNKIKRDLVEQKGGACELCGYKKNYAALIFHHVDPSKKEIALDARSMGNISMKRLLDEFSKCQLLCSNCHCELHNPQLSI